MEKGNNTGDLFREAFKDFEKKPSDKVWSNIENSVKAPNVHKQSFFKSKNFIVGSVAIVAVSVILYFVLQPEQPKDVQLQTVNAQTVENENNEPPVVENEQNSVASSIKAPDEQKKTVRVTNNNDLKNNNLPKTTSKKQNINDLIAEIESKQTVFEDVVEESAAKAIVVSEISNTVSKEAVDKQQLVENNVIVPKNSPVTEITFSSDQTICKGEKVKLSVNGGVSYLWSTGEITQYIIVDPTASVDYSVIATDENENRKVGLISITVSDCNAPYIPNAFTPNGDGQSDIFKVYGNDIAKFEIIIVSRSGQVVFTSKNINEAWDGNIKGRQAPMGTYVYSIKYTNELNTEQLITGHVTLIR